MRSLCFYLSLVISVFWRTPLIVPARRTPLQSHRFWYHRSIGARHGLWHNRYENNLMIAALILVISGAMLAQFLVFFWRANMLAVAAEPLSESFSPALKLDDFDSVAAMSKICPSVTVLTSQLWQVRAYYQAVRVVSWLCSAMPQANSWARQEMVSCTRFVAVSMDRCLQSNQAYMAALRSY
jgi:hypothetical protein